jgi:hypothetical protein
VIDKLSKHIGKVFAMEDPTVSDISDETTDADEDWVSIEVNGVSYGHQSQEPACVLSGSFGREFPRRFVSAGDLLLEAHEMASGEFCTETHIYIPSSIETLGSNCCDGCGSLVAVAFGFDSKLSSIEEFAFAYCNSLSAVCIPSSAETLCERCFLECTSLSTVSFESGSRLAFLGEFAFGFCESLSSISLLLGLQVFHGTALFCTDIVYISITEDNTRLTICGDFFLDSERISVERHFGMDNEVRIENRIEELQDSCFARCSTLSNILCESGSRLAMIGDSAFHHCHCLSSICMPSSVKMLARNCFEDCISLLTVTFESDSKLSCIRNCAFRSCRALSLICIPASVQNLGIYCFEDCLSLSTVTFE